MEFLGQVNMFHGRVHNGKTLLEGMVLDYPHVAKMKARPHESTCGRTNSTSSSRPTRRPPAGRPKRR